MKKLAHACYKYGLFLAPKLLIEKLTFMLAFPAQRFLFVATDYLIVSILSLSTQNHRYELKLEQYKIVHLFPA